MNSNYNNCKTYKNIKNNSSKNNNNESHDKNANNLIDKDDSMEDVLQDIFNNCKNPKSNNEENNENHKINNPFSIIIPIYLEKNVYLLKWILEPKFLVLIKILIKIC